MLAATGRRLIVASSSRGIVPSCSTTRAYASKGKDPFAVEIPPLRGDGADAPSSADVPLEPPGPGQTTGLPPKPPKSGRLGRGKQVKSPVGGEAAPLEDRISAQSASLPGAPNLVEDQRPPSEPTTAHVTAEGQQQPGGPMGTGGTLAETSSSSFASQMLDLASDVPPPRDQGPTGAKSKTGKRSLSSIERRRQMMSRVLLAGMAVGGAAWVWNMGREWEDEKERRVLGQGEEGSRASRSKARIVDMFDYFNKPAWEPLIPPPLPEPHGRPYTLLVDLDDFLVNSTWTRDAGWRTAKRPGLEYFLGYLSQFYEIVIFTTQPAYTAIPICEKIDPYGYYAPYKLFRESCRSQGVWTHKIFKDLDYLGRDLSKVVWLDTKPELFALQPDNGFAVPAWKGDRNDTGLVDLIPLLEAIAFNEVRDVRDVARAYKGKDPVRAYSESEARQKRELLERWETEKESRGTAPRFNIGSLFGLASAANPDEPPQLPVEKQRQRAQQAYVEDQKYWKDNEASLKKLMDEDRERQMAEMRSSVLGFLSGQNLGPPKPPGSEAPK